MSCVNLLRGLVREAGTSVRVRARMHFLAAAVVGAAALFCAPGAARADSGHEWLQKVFAKPSQFHAFRPPQKLGAPMPKSDRRRSRRSKHVQTASLGPVPTPSVPSGNAAGGRGIQWSASAQCLAPSLRAMLAHISANYGRVRVNSTCRSKRHNRRVGGAPRSYHLTGNAADFRVFGNVSAALAYLRSTAGGLKHYGGGLFHIDTGPRRRM